MTELRVLQSLDPDPLRWAIFLCMMAPTASFATGGLEAITGPGGTPLINPGHGVPVIDIVAPNVNGLSHNQFLDYNVGQSGVVMNNALEAGQSQLVGALAANPQFQGQAASVILNEVISQNASMVAGPQEIFGRPADYILANPNGITLNGGSFINTTRAGFVVGTPLIENQQFKGLDTRNATGQLHVLEGGIANEAGMLDLIAPKVTTQGPLNSKEDLNIIVGRNRLAADSLEVLEHLPGQAGSIDASLFGAMRAGRIRMLSTAEGAGVRMGPAQVKTSDGLSVRSAGGLSIEGSDQRKAHLQVDRGAIALDAADDLTLSALTGSADNIELTAGKKLTLDGKTREKISHERDSWSKKFLFVTNETYSSDSTTTERTQHGVMLSAREDMKLRSGNDLALTGATLDAGDLLAVDAGGTVDIAAAIDSRRRETRVRHRKNLWRGDKDTDDYRESADSSVLKSRSMTVNAGGDVRIKGSRLHSEQDMQITGRHVEIAETQIKDNTLDRDYRGDLVSGTFFADRNGKDSQGTQAVGSELQAGGKMKITAQSATVRGSEVSSKDDAVLYSEDGLLQISSALSTRKGSDTRSDRQVFNLLGSSSERSHSDQQLLSSDIHSTGNLRLASARELKIEGARISAAQKLEVEAVGDLTISSAASEQTSQSTEQTRGVTAYARQTREAEGEKPGSRQYDAGVGYEVATVTEKGREVKHTASQLKGGSVDLSSGETLRVVGSKVNAEAGDVTLKASKIETLASRNEKTSDVTRTHSGGGLQVTGGIDKVGSQYEGHRNQTTTTETDSLVQRSELQASGDVNLGAAQVVNEATLIQPGKTLKVIAEHVENRAADDIKTREETTDNWSGTLGASLEYRDITRPIERLVEGGEAARFQQASTEDAMTAPSIGADVGITHHSETTRDDQRTARVTELSTGAIDLKADTLIDIGTAYTARQSDIKIEAQAHKMLAAHDSHTLKQDRLNVEGTLRIDTSTGHDVNGRVTSVVSKVNSETRSDTARVGSLQAQTGIQVQLGSEGLYEGTRLDGGSGPVQINAAQGLHLSAATDTDSRSTSQFDGSLWGKGGNRPGKAGIDARGYADHTRYQSVDSKAHGGQIDTTGTVTLSGGDLRLEGLRIGSRKAPVAGATLQSDGLIEVVAAQDTHTAKGKTLGGGMELAASTGDMKGGGIGGHLTSARIDERSSTAVDPGVHTTGMLGIASMAREAQAIHLQGLQASAKAIELNASKGGMLIESSSNIDRRDNLEITAGAGFSLSKGEHSADDIRALHVRAKVDVDKRDNQRWNDSALRADQVMLNSSGDMHIEGARIDADRVQGRVNGDLLVNSRKDNIDSTAVKVDARLSQEKNPQGYLNAAASVAGPVAGKVKEKAGSALVAFDPSFSPTLRVEASRIQNDSVAYQSGIKGSQGIDLDVAGDTRLLGARLQAPQGKVALGASTLTAHTLHGQDYRRDVSIDASNSVVDLGTAVAELSKSKGAAEGENALDFGLVRTSGYTREHDWKAVVQQQRGGDQ